MVRVQDEETIEKSNLDPKKPTKFIIHGFIDTPLSNWVSVQDCNLPLSFSTNDR